jgi:hypothetical protein
VPLPRYILVACCNDTSNRQTPEFISEISGAEKCLMEAAAADEQTGEARILNILGFFGSPESSF